MNLQQILKNQQLKKSLQEKKKHKIKQKIQARQRQKVNLDQSHLKTGKIQKTKIIEKKRFATVVEKARKIKVQVQENVHPGTFINESQQYTNILNRTTNYIKFDQQKLEEGCKAILAFAQAHQQKHVTLSLTMENAIQCHQWPTMLKIPYHDQNQSVASIAVTNKKQQLQSKSLIHFDMRIMDAKEFNQKLKQDKKIKKEIKANRTKLFCDMRTYKASKMVPKLLSQNIPIFPIDMLKIPNCLQYSSQQSSTKQQVQCKDYKDYLNLLHNQLYFIAKSGTQHRINVPIGSLKISQFVINLKNIVWQAVARLIFRDKIRKGNKLVKLQVKSQSSANIELYSSAP